MLSARLNVLLLAVILVTLPGAKCSDDEAGTSPSTEAPPTTPRLSFPPEIARYVAYVAGSCPVAHTLAELAVLSMCGSGTNRTIGEKCIDLAAFEADGTEVPNTRMYQFTLDCGGNDPNQNPPPSYVADGVKFVVGPAHPSIIDQVSAEYATLKTALDALEREDSRDMGRLVQAQKDVEAAEKKLAMTLLQSCVGFVYAHNDNAIPESNIFTDWNYEQVVADAAGNPVATNPMVTTKSFGSLELHIYGEALYRRPFQPTPEIFVASLLHEMFHWTQRDSGDDGVALHKPLFELATTEFMSVHPYYKYVLGDGVANGEFNVPQRTYWESAFAPLFNPLAACEKKAVADWAWGDVYMRSYMVFGDAQSTVWSAVNSAQYETCP